VFWLPYRRSPCTETSVVFSAVAGHPCVLSVDVEEDTQHLTAFPHSFAPSWAGASAPKCFYLSRCVLHHCLTVRVSLSLCSFHTSKLQSACTGAVLA
jgi:hypothetical protein